MKTFFIFLAIIFCLTSVSAIKINEFVVDPKTDWDESGTIGPSDEWIELFNEDTIPVNLTDWKLLLVDSSPANQTLGGTIAIGEHLVILNPTGDLTMNGQIILYNSIGEKIDSVTYGDWDDDNIEDNAPDGDANNASDECLARIPDGADSDNDLQDFQKVAGTYGKSNSETDENETGENEQVLNATISEMISMQISPKVLEFGLIFPGTNGNAPSNGPIVFNASGSNAKVLVKVSSVEGQLFEKGLFIDGKLPTANSWTFNCIRDGSKCNYEIQSANPTLDVPLGSIAGANEGTMTYLITGSPPD